MSDVQQAERMARRIRALAQGGYRFGGDLPVVPSPGLEGLEKAARDARGRALFFTGVVGLGLVMFLARRRKGR